MKIRSLLTIALCVAVGIASQTGCGKKKNAKAHAGITDNGRDVKFIRGALIRYSPLNEEAKYTIPSGVTRIHTAAFEDCGSLTKVTIPGSVKTIALGAFRRCENLTEVTIAEGVEVIDPYAFQNCVNLTDITIPDGVRIRAAAFEGCSSLKHVILPPHVKLDPHAFYKCPCEEQLRRDYPHLF